MNLTPPATPNCEILARHKTEIDAIMGFLSSRSHLHLCRLDPPLDHIAHYTPVDNLMEVYDYFGIDYWDLEKERRALVDHQIELQAQQKKND